MQNLYVDVREEDEFLSEHIEGAISIPLSDFDIRAKYVLQEFSKRKIVLICRSGNRAKLAQNQLKDLNINFDVFPEVYEGGMIEWVKKGLPTVRSSSSMMPLLRQVHLAAGLLILLAVLGIFFIHFYFIYLALFVGLGLSFSGLTGFCGMALLLAKMPWNR